MKCYIKCIKSVILNKIKTLKKTFINEIINRWNQQNFLCILFFKLWKVLFINNLRIWIHYCYIIETSANKSPQVLREDVQYYLLLTKIYKLSERLDDAMTSLEQARDIQIQLVKRTSSELSDMAEKEKLTLAQLVIYMTYTTINCILFEE